jgi:hypothetical protein
MTYRVSCEIHVGSDYDVEANSATEAEEIAYNMFVRDYGLEDNSCLLGFGIVTDVEEVESEDEEE